MQIEAIEKTEKAVDDLRTALKIEGVHIAQRERIISECTNLGSACAVSSDVKVNIINVISKAEQARLSTE